MSNVKITAISLEVSKAMKKSLSLTLAVIIVSAAFVPARSQEPASQQPASQQPTEDDAAKQKAELEKNAFRLLDQVIDEA